MDKQTAQDAAKKTGVFAAFFLKHFGRAVIAGIKAHPEAIPELAGMIASQKVDTAELTKIAIEVGTSGAASELQAQ